MFLFGVRDKPAPILYVEVEDTSQVHPTVGLPRALDAHFRDQGELGAKIDGEGVHLLHKVSVVDSFSCRLYDDIQLMRCAPNAQHTELSALRKTRHNTGVATGHGILSVRRHVEQLCAPF